MDYARYVVIVQSKFAHDTNIDASILQRAQQHTDILKLHGSSLNSGHEVDFCVWV